jgi:hypothetical protein
MSKKPSAPLKITPLQYITAEPIIDPAEQAALDRHRKRNKRRPAEPKSKKGNGGRGSI